MSQPARSIVTDTRRLSHRVARSAASVDALGTHIDAWFVRRRADPTFRRFAWHLQVLETVLVRMLPRLRAELASAGEEVGAGYDHCRRVDGGLATLRRLFLWYAAKYDQRATETIRSC